MSANKELHDELVSKWSRIVAECDSRRIGDTIDAWCKRKGISKWKLYYWKRALRDTAAGCSCGDCPEERCLDITDVLSDQDSGHTGDIYPKYTLSNGESTAPHRCLPSADQVPPATHPNIMIQSGDFRIYVGDGVRESTLAAVLRAIPND